PRRDRAGEDGDPPNRRVRVLEVNRLTDHSQAQPVRHAPTNCLPSRDLQAEPGAVTGSLSRESSHAAGERIGAEALLRFCDEYRARSTGTAPLRGKEGHASSIEDLGPRFRFRAKASLRPGPVAGCLPTRRSRSPASGLPARRPEVSTLRRRTGAGLGATHSASSSGGGPGGY